MVSIKQIVKRAIGEGKLTFEDFITVPEAAKKLHITRSGVYWRIATGKLPSKRFGSQLLIKKADL